MTIDHTRPSAFISADIRVPSQNGPNRKNDRYNRDSISASAAKIRLNLRHYSAK